MRSSGVQRRLVATSKRLQRAREELAQVEAQLGALRHDADDARVDALVRGPAERRDAAHAERHVEKLSRSRDRLAAEVAALLREQDELLDRLPTPR